MLSSDFFKITQAKHLCSAKNAESLQQKNCFFSTIYCEFQKSSFKKKIITSGANRKGIHNYTCIEFLHDSKINQLQFPKLSLQRRTENSVRTWVGELFYPCFWCFYCLPPLAEAVDKRALWLLLLHLVITLLSCRFFRVNTKTNVNIERQYDLKTFFLVYCTSRNWFFFCFSLFKKIHWFAWSTKLWPLPHRRNSIFCSSSQ